MPEIAEELYAAAARRARRPRSRARPTANIRIPRALTVAVRSGLRSAPVALSIIVAVAVVVVALAVKHGSGSAHHGAPANAAGDAHPAFRYPTSITYVERHMRAALADERNDISVSTTTYIPRAGAANGYANRSWFDPLTRAQRSEHITSSGTIQSELAETVTTTPGMVHWHYIELDFANHTWYRYTQNDRDSLKPQASTSAAFGLLSLPRCPYAVAGTTTIDGQDTIVLQPANRPGHHCSGPTWWVNASTYQLVRRGQGGGGAGSMIGAPGTTTTYRWIPRTPTSVALTKIQIPAGFTKSKSPPPFNPSAY
jgi:hypothetical protein